MATFNALYVLTMMIVCSQLIYANNVCYVEESGCKFRVTVLPISSCPVTNQVNDQPDVAKVTRLDISLLAKYCEIIYFNRFLSIMTTAVYV